MFSAREEAWYEKRDNLRKYGHRVLDWEITNIVVDEIAPLLGEEVLSMLSPMAQYWISEHKDCQQDSEDDNAGFPDTGSSDSGQAGLDEDQESHTSIRLNSDSGVLVEDTE